MCGPMATNMPPTFSSLDEPSTVFFSLMPVTCLPSPSNSSTTLFQTSLILGMIQGSLLHDLRGPQFMSAVHQVDNVCVLQVSQVRGLFNRRIAATDYGQRFSRGKSVVRHRKRASADTFVFIHVFGLQPQVVGASTVATINRVRFYRLAIARCDDEGALREIDIDNVVAYDPGAEIQGLCFINSINSMPCTA